MVTIESFWHLLLHRLELVSENVFAVDSDFEAAGCKRDCDLEFFIDFEGKFGAALLVGQPSGGRKFF